MAIEQDDVDLCHTLMGEGSYADAGVLECGCTSVLYFLQRNSLRIAEFLISKGASIAGAACLGTEPPHFTPLHYAAERGHVKILEAMLEKAPLELLQCCEPAHPIGLAVASGHAKCVELIMNHARKGTMNS